MPVGQAVNYHGGVASLADLGDGLGGGIVVGGVELGHEADNHPRHESGDDGSKGVPLQRNVQPENRPQGQQNDDYGRADDSSSERPEKV